MSSSSKQPDEPPTPPDSRAVILLLRDMGDVTWRMALPVIGGILIGMAVDEYAALKPWGILMGLIAGLGLTVLLVRNLYKKL